MTYLCDALQTADGAVEAAADLARAIRGMARQVADCPRYVLGDDVMAAVTAVASDKPTNLVRLLDLARLPHDRLWIEYGFRAKLACLQADGVNIRDTGKEAPVRYGVLLTALNEDRTSWMMEPAWNFASGHVEFSTAAMVVETGSRAEISADEEVALLADIERSLAEPRNTYYRYRNSGAQKRAMLALQAAAEFSVSAMGHAMTRSIVMAGASEDAAVSTTLRLLDAHAQDVSDESLMIVAALLMLNTPNGAYRQVEDRSKLRRAREKKGKPPVLDFHHVTMRLSRPERAAGSLATGGAGGPKSRHVCRGHFKRRKRADGSVEPIWWRDHWRGAGSNTKSPVRVVKL